MNPMLLDPKGSFWVPNGMSHFEECHWEVTAYNDEVWENGS